MTRAQDVLDLMADNRPRTAQQIVTALHGPQTDGALWWRVSLCCDRLVKDGRLYVVGMAQRRAPGMLGWTVYQI